LAAASGFVVWLHLKESNVSPLVSENNKPWLDVSPLVSENNQEWLKEEDYPIERLPELIEYLSDKNWLIRCRAAGLIAQFGERANAALPKLIELALVEVPEEKEPIPTVPVWLSSIPPEKYTLVMKIMATKQEAISTISKVGPKSDSVREALLRLSRNEDSVIRAQATHALGAIQPTEQTESRLDELLIDPDPRVSAAARRALLKPKEPADSSSGEPP